MRTVLLATVRMLEFLDGGGHFWVYMQYAEGLRRQGCEVYLLDTFTGQQATQPDRESIDRFLDHMAAYNLRDRVIIAIDGPDADVQYVGPADVDVPDLLRSVDLLINFNYGLTQEVVSHCRRSALIDIDPGLLQFWISTRMLKPAAHDTYFTIGETVGRPGSAIPDCGLHWIAIRPAVCLELWPYTYRSDAKAFTTVSTWWGHKEYVGSKNSYFDNNKRVSYLRFAELPEHTDQSLELALYLGDADEPDRRLLEGRGWRIRHSREVAGSPEAYRSYIQSSRGEFSCAKPSCAKFSNAWVSDRSLCYLASGKPVVAQYTGPSSYLPDGQGLFRFKTIGDAVGALEAINSDYERQCRLARRLAEEQFDATAVTRTILEQAL
jgi:glycosyltransferase involved in cell wall biosynthesis